MLKLVYYLLFIPLVITSAHFVIVGLHTFSKRKADIARHAPRHRLGIIIPARNEENVIGALISSLRDQDYPDSLYDIYVVPNNCTDETEQAARNAGAQIIYITGTVRSKGEVLKQAYAQLLDMGRHDAFVVFDADNLVHPEFLGRMNDALCDGYNVAQGYRDSKNANESWISGTSSIYFWMLDTFFDRARMKLGQSAAIHGTGFMMRREVLEKTGLETVTMTEDTEFTIQCALHDERIAFVEKAIVYDEQPFDLRSSVKQRSRWSMGSYQCFYTYHRALVKKAIYTRSFSAVDMLFMTSGAFMQIVYFVLSLAVMAYNMAGLTFDAFSAQLFTYSDFFTALASYSLQAGVALLAVYMNRRRGGPVYLSALLFPVFMLTWLPINIFCLFKKNISWEPIAHRKKITIEDAIGGKH